MSLSIFGVQELGLANHVGRAASFSAHGPGVRAQCEHRLLLAASLQLGGRTPMCWASLCFQPPALIPEPPKCSCPNPVPAAQTGTGMYGAPGSDQDLSFQLYIFSCLIVRAECTRLCCRMLPLGSWQRLILKCQLLSGGAGSNESQWFVLIPGTMLPSPCFRNHRNAGSGAPEKEMFSLFLKRR